MFDLEFAKNYDTVVLFLTVFIYVEGFDQKVQLCGTFCVDGRTSCPLRSGSLGGDVCSALGLAQPVSTLQVHSPNSEVSSLSTNLLKFSNFLALSQRM